MAPPPGKCWARHPSRNVNCYLDQGRHAEQLRRPGNSGGVTHCGVDRDRQPFEPFKYVFWTNRDLPVTNRETT